MNKRSSERTLILEEEPESLFWDSQVYRKLDFKNLKKKSFRYYDDTSFRSDFKMGTNIFKTR
nr:hypothetical protein MACL_00001016 [Theileria orientalis]